MTAPAEPTTERGADRELDLRGQVCPFTFARAKIALEGMELGQVLRVLLDNPRSAQNVPRAMEVQGQDVLSVDEIEPGLWAAVIEKVRPW